MKFHFFWGGLLSNWSPSSFTFQGVNYSHNEQFMMAGKARLFNDQETLRRILAAPTPKEQKALGRTVRNFDPAKWNLVCRDIVYIGCCLKFSQNSPHQQELLAHPGQTFVEASPHDRIWGIGLTATDPRAQDPTKWLGENRLGQILTALRDDMQVAKGAAWAKADGLAKGLEAQGIRFS